MNEFVKLLARQLRRDARMLPRRVRRRFSAASRVERYGSIEELRAGFRRAVPKALFDFVDGGASDEVTLARNRSDFAALSIVPRALVDVSHMDLSTSVLGQAIDLPILGAPMGVLGPLHPGGEAAIARAVHDAGSITALGCLGSHSIEEVRAQVPGKLWFQLYGWRDRELIRELVGRAHAAGYLALVLTVDVPVAATRDRDRRNGFSIPPRVTLRSLGGGLIRPRWAYRFVREPRIQVANLVGRSGAFGDALSVTQFVGSQFDPALSWADLAWFREIWVGPLVIKGILNAEDARQAVSLGADAVIVSNHGGRQLDHAPSTISVLPAVVDGVGHDVEVYFDGGVRRGSDVLKALAAGARACFVGRPLAYGLGVGGEAGARQALRILETELRSSMALSGCPSVQALDRGWLSGLAASPAESAARAAR